MKKVILSVGIVVIFVIVGISAWKMASRSNIDQPVACTEEAKLCSDGSAVGRTGPNCAFAECPIEQLSATSSWLMYTDTTTGFSFRYPAKLDTEYIHPVEWPPQIVVSGTPFVCDQGGSEISATGENIEGVIDAKHYCLNTKSEGAAGSIFTSYSYSFAYEGDTVTLSFTLRSVQCDNYDDPQKTACIKERNAFKIDEVVRQILESVRAHDSLSGVVKNPMCIEMGSEVGWIDVHSHENKFGLKIPSDWKIARYFNVFFRAG